ncbi:MAG: ATP-binding protein [Acidobacteriota bacterium]|nr:ATP-binding protein [Acidobacteriota bacterium]
MTDRKQSTKQDAATAAQQQLDPEAIVNAFPTKELFISMLVKDITLIPAIKDLVDNAVDGARRIRPDGDYKGLTVYVEFDADHFRIVDKCGGISNEVARKYAFRFGRPDDAGQQPRSIGQFGVGMKRALFKMGSKFHVHSIADRSWFTRGTTITVTELHDGVAAEFVTDSFVAQLIDELQDAHREALDGGLAISVNRVTLRTQPLTLLDSAKLKPTFVTKSITPPGRKPVKVKLYAGLSRSKSDQDAAGWYIFCNGRMIVAADQNVLTGWGEGSTKRIPKFHPQFSMFRGYVFFDSDDAQLLPWNTMKTGIDTDSPLYRSIKLEMMNIMRPILDFSYKWDAEKEKFEGDDGPLRKAVRSAKEVRLREVKPNATFVAPKPLPSRNEPEVVRITAYTVPKDRYEAVKRKLRATSAKEVGEKTFEYFYDMESSDDA